MLTIEQGEAAGVARWKGSAVRSTEPPLIRRSCRDLCLPTVQWRSQVEGRGQREVCRGVSETEYNPGSVSCWEWPLLPHPAPQGGWEFHSGQAFGVNKQSRGLCGWSFPLLLLLSPRGVLPRPFVAFNPSTLHWKAWQGGGRQWGSAGERGAGCLAEISPAAGSLCCAWVSHRRPLHFPFFFWR